MRENVPVFAPRSHSRLGRRVEVCLSTKLFLRSKSLSSYECVSEYWDQSELRRAVRQSVDESRQAVQQGQERHPGLPALGHRALRVGATTSHPPLRLRREPHVRQDAALEPPQPVEVFGRVLRRYAVQARAQQRLKGYAEMRHEHERREERKQNCRYPRQYSPFSHGTKDGTSVKRGRAPIHWMLNGVASLSIQPFRTAVSSRRSCRSAASLSIENGHSYGQVTNSTASCSTVAAQPISITREAAGRPWARRSSSLCRHQRPNGERTARKAASRSSQPPRRSAANDTGAARLVPTVHPP